MFHLLQIRAWVPALLGAMAFGLRSHFDQPAVLSPERSGGAVPSGGESAVSPSPDRFDLSIDETCRTLEEIGLPIDRHDGTPLLETSSKYFRDSCRGLFREAVAYQQSVLRVEPRIWSPDLLRNFRDLMVSHGAVDRDGQLRAVMNASQEMTAEGLYRGGVDRYTFQAGRVALGLFSLCPDDRESMRFNVEHELGHGRDQEKIKQAVPQAVPLIGEERLSGQEMDRLFWIYFSLIEDRLPPTRQVRFRQQAESLFFGPLRSLQGRDWGVRLVSYQQVMAEVVRYGEEYHDPRLAWEAEEVLPASFKFFDEGTAEQKRQVLEGQRQTKHPWYLHRCTIMAKYELAGFGGRFRERADLEPVFLEELDPEDVAFFREAILATERFQVSQK